MLQLLEQPLSDPQATPRPGVRAEIRTLRVHLGVMIMLAMHDLLEADSVAAPGVGNEVNFTFSENNTLVFELNTGIRMGGGRFHFPPARLT